VSATEFDVDLRDIRFVLFEQIKVQEQLMSVPRYADYDQETYDSMVQAAYDLATQVIGPTNKVGDRTGVKLDSDGNVTTPPGFKEAYAQLCQSGMLGVAIPAEQGGMGLPHVVDIAMHEMLTGANTAFNIYPGLTRAAANLLTTHYAPAWLRELAVPKMLGGEWAGTMCLTEAGAGSAVGDNRCRAVPTGKDDGSYLLTGEKVFISGGDNDFTGNILHLVLARAPDAPAGTKGLSIFAVPKFLFDEIGRAHV
jgi:alkylation response protein AidB-like acyl-CoA dehydrogenase